MAALFTEYSENPVRRWEDLIKAESNFSTPEEWVFRGQDCNNFPATSLERHCKNIGIKRNQIADLEVKLIRDFARRYHLYAGSTPPQQGNTLQWLSLLQHYGTPTRLVDFTYSFFIATFFAIACINSPSVIWCFNVLQLKNGAQGLIKKERRSGSSQISKYQEVRDNEPFRKLFMSQPRIRFAYPTNPINLNDRLSIQQGLFIAPGDVTATFEENVRAVPNHSKNIVRVIIDPKCRRTLLKKLYRAGVNHETLFPGLQGFARSLREKSLILSDLPKQGVKMLEQV